MKSRGEESSLGIAGYRNAVEIGRGGFAVVYRAWQPEYRRTVAIKVLHAGGLEDDARSRFEAELQAMGSLSGHPHIVTLYDHGMTGEGSPYLVMGFEEGGSLAARLRRAGPMPWQEAGAVGVKMAGALETAHRAGLLHRDVKPENVLLSAYGEPKLADFGIARLQGSAVTRTGALLASIPHAAPELLDGAPPSVATDVYALGSTLYTLLRGRPAFVGAADEGPLPVISRIGAGEVPDLRPSGVPHAVCAVLERAMAKDPRDRPHTAESLGVELRAAGGAGGVSWPEPPVREAELPPPTDDTPTEVLRRWTPRGIRARAGRRTLAGAALVCLIAVGAVLSSELLRPSPLTPGGGARWSPREAMRTSRFLHALTTGSDGLVYVIGGSDWNADGSALDTVVAYDPRTRTWGDRPSLNDRRWGAAATTAKDGLIVVIGGVKSRRNYAPLATVEALSPEGTGWRYLKPLPAPRSRLAAVTAPDGTIWAIGGFDAAGHAVDTVEIYDPRSDSWSESPQRLHGARGDLAAAVLPDGRIYAIAGDVDSADGTLRDVGTVEMWSPANHSWQQAPPLPVACSSPAVAVGSGGQLYVIGGIAGSTPLTSVERLQQRRWAGVTPLALARATAATSGADGTLYVVGGLDGYHRALDVVEAYRP